MRARGISLDNPEKDFNSAMEYVNIFNNLKTPPSGYEGQISGYINSGDMKGLETYVNRHVENDIKANLPADEFISS
jgi:hypothetical protein